MKQKPDLYCFTKYHNAGPSSRYRTLQYLACLEEDFKVQIQAGFGDWYLDGNYNKALKICRLLMAFFYRWYQVLTLPSNCVAWIEYELFPYMPPIAEWYLRLRKIPYSVDYDDAVFHNYDQSGNWFLRHFLRNKIPWVMKHAHTVVTGSPYLTKFAFQFNNNTIEIPTAIASNRYFENNHLLPTENTNTFIVGWLGSKTTSHNLGLITAAFKEFVQNANAELWLMGFDPSMAHLLTGLPVKFFKWESEKEIPFLNTINVGIMPLLDTPFNHGKCGFKLIQYMAAGKPTISTPLDANIKINRHGANLFATNTSEWLSAFCYFKSNPVIAVATGRENRKIVKQFYDKTVTGIELGKVISNMKVNN